MGRYDRSVSLVDQSGNPVNVGNPLPTTGSGGGGGGGAATLADGADICQGSINDIAVTGDNPGTISAKMRGLLKIITDVWDGTNHWLQVSIQNATLAVTQSGSWSVIATSVIGSWTDRSGTIAAGGISQQLMAPNATRKGWIVQNTGKDVLWINFTAVVVTSQPSLKIPVGGGYEEIGPGPISTQQVNIIGPTTGQAYTAKEM